ncbi:anti-sigma factor family protein [Streptomyces sp. NPDC006259]|uniref:anti-sigma factor family protein n=1 Tax=Streptomyces sp. NPDC006259 TaxID=3364740 RepID=UPI003693B327
MTSTTDTAGHPDVAEISDLTEGLLTPARSAEVRRHLETCGLCADVHASLEEIKGLLGALPGPTRMPDDVAHRIDAALAAEAPVSATTAELPDASRAAASGSDSTAAHVSRETPTAPPRPAGHARGRITGPGRKNHRLRGRRRIAVLGTVFAVASLGLGSVLVSSLTGEEGAGTASPGRKATVADTFSKDGLEQQVADLLATAPDASPHTLGMQGEPETGSPRVFHQPAVPGCVQKGIDRKDAALAVDKGTYQGKEALLVVLPDSSDSTRVTAYLMDATCVRQPSSGTAEILLEDSYTRP